VVAVDLVPPDGGTWLRLIPTGFPDKESNNRHEEAWPKVLAPSTRDLAARVQLDGASTQHRNNPGARSRVL